MNNNEKKVIIVGNGVCATLTENGNKIDKFDEVWRFFPIYSPNKEHIKYIGSKTDAIILKNKKSYKKEIYEKTIPFCKKNNIRYVYRHNIKISYMVKYLSTQSALNHPNNAPNVSPTQLIKVSDISFPPGQIVK